MEVAELKLILVRIINPWKSWKHRSLHR